LSERDLKAIWFMPLDLEEPTSRPANVLGAGILAAGNLSVPVRLLEGLIFFTFLLFFEFTLVLLDPYIEQYNSGAPAY